MVKVSLFLINSYVSRLLIGVIAIIIISAGALVSMAECQSFQQISTNSDGCTCINFSTWKSRVKSPDPGDISCQFPQVIPS